jgi:uncharacterized protein YndB with AHSA1/START domain
MEDETIHRVAVGLPPGAAFRLFTEGFGRWWPRDYSWGGEALLDIGMEPRPGGACREIGPHGFRCDWGRVTGWDPPRRVAFTWQVGFDRTPLPDPSMASEVEVTFAPAGARTEVVLRHHGFSRHGAQAEAYREGMAGPHGWPLILARFAALAG